MTLDDGMTKDSFNYKPAESPYCENCIMQTKSGRQFYCRAFGQELFLAKGEGLPVKALWTSVLERCKECKEA